MAPAPGPRFQQEETQLRRPVIQPDTKDRADAPSAAQGEKATLARRIVVGEPLVHDLLDKAPETRVEAVGLRVERDVTLDDPGDVGAGDGADFDID